MMTSLLLFLIISSGSIFAINFFDRKYEEVVPLTIFSIIAILYIFGLIGYLKAGVFFVCILTVLLYGLSFYKLTIKKKYKKFFLKLFTPAFFIFIVAYLFLIWGNYNKLAHSWDDFSHWADIVKTMYTINDFGTSALSNSQFQSYPPAISLFQYFVQVLNGTYSEWLLYLSQQVIGLSLFLTFLKKLSFKKPRQIFISLITILFIPLVFYNNFYNMLQVDPLLGMMFGFTLAMIYKENSFDYLNTSTILLSLFILVLTKDAGLLFALISFIAFSTNLFLMKFNSNEIHSTRNKIISVNIILALLIIVFANYSWQYNISVNNARIQFSNSIDFKEFFSIISNYFMGRRINYRSDVLFNFINEFITTGISFGKIEFIYLQVLIVLFFSLIFTNKVSTEYVQDNYRNKQPIISIIAFTLLFYIVGLIPTYMFKFTEYEALKLASFSRYINIIFNMVLFFVSMSLINIFISEEKYNNNLILLSMILLLVTPYTSINNLLSRKDISYSVQVRSPFTKITNKAANVFENKNSKVYLISQADTGFDYWVLRYNLRPNQVEGWSIGDPAYNDSIYNRDITVEEWKDELLKEYDYVLLYKIDDYFIENYNSAFLNSTDIAENSVYKVDKDLELLTIVE